MTAKERVATSLAHREPDRVPTFELAFSTKLAGEALGREVFFPRSGGSSLKRILQANQAGSEARRALIREGTLTQVEVYTAFGYDAMYLIPTEFLQPVLGSYGLFGSNYLFEVTYEELAPNRWRATSEEGFWTTFGYEPTADAFFVIDDNLKHGGMPALRRYVEVLEARDPGLNDYTRDALESTRLAVEAAAPDKLFVLGHGDVCHPNDQGYIALFLEAMATEPELVDRFFAATTAGILPLVEAQLDLGVDGILGATDWCFKTGPIMSPAMFRRFFVPHLRAIADLAHRRGKPYLKHLDGNTESLLPMLIEEVGIDAYHSIEPSAGMDLAKLKAQWGERISLWGNLDCGGVLMSGTPQQVREQTREILRVAAPGGGFVLASSNAIHDGIPMENLRAMLQAAREYGTYPLHL